MNFAKFKQTTERYFIFKNEIYVEAENLKQYLKTENKDEIKTVKKIVDMQNLEKMYEKALETSINVKKRLVPLVRKIVAFRETETVLKSTVEKINEKMKIFNLFNVNLEYLQHQIEIFLKINKINYAITQSDSSINICTNAYAQDGQRLIISLCNDDKPSHCANQIFKNLQDYYLSNPKTNDGTFSFMQILKKVNLEYAKEMYDILWDSVKQYYEKINDDKIEKHKNIIANARKEIAKYSNKNYIEKLIEQLKKEKEELNVNLNEINNKILMEENLRSNKIKKKKLEQKLYYVETDIKGLSNPKFLDMIINIDTQWIINSTAEIKRLTKKNHNII